MSHIQYFKRQDATGWVAVAPGQYQESVMFWEISGLVSARIEVHKNEIVAASYYEKEDSKFCACSREEYLAARYKAQTITAEFFGEYQQFQTPPAVTAQVRKPSPPTVMLATGQVIQNDLPF